MAGTGSPFSLMAITEANAGSQIMHDSSYTYLADEILVLYTIQCTFVVYARVVLSASV